MHCGDGGGSERLQHEIPVGDGIERIRHRRGEAERLRRHAPVDWERGASQRRSTEGAKVRPLARIGKPATVTRRHFDIGKEMVAKGYGLGDLQMGEARHYGRGVFERLLHERALVGGQRLINLIDRRPDPHPEIGCDLIVARSRGVQPPRRRSDQLGEPALHVHMNVLERPLELELAALDL
jgi:hypothetical protein